MIHDKLEQTRNVTKMPKIDTQDALGDVITTIMTTILTTNLNKNRDS